MCELFALSSDRPANVTFSLGVFGERGGRLGPHKDGWGIAFKEGRDFRLIKEAVPAAASACLRFIESHEFRSEIVMSHLRLISVLRNATDTNTHPFACELYNATHVFANNSETPIREESRSTGRAPRRGTSGGESPETLIEIKASHSRGRIMKSRVGSQRP